MAWFLSPFELFSSLSILSSITWVYWGFQSVASDFWQCKKCFMASSLQWWHFSGWLIWIMLPLTCPCGPTDGQPTVGYPQNSLSGALQGKSSVGPVWAQSPCRISVALPCPHSPRVHPLWAPTGMVCLRWGSRWGNCKACSTLLSIFILKPFSEL